MKTEELKDYLSKSGITAEQLLDEIDPKLKSRFQRALSTLEKIIDEVREVYPDANYYLNDDQTYILLGDSHTSHTGIQPTSNMELVAVSDKDGKLIGKIGGGGW